MQVADWMATADDRAIDGIFALEAVAWGQALPVLAGRLGEDQWWGLLNRVLALADEGRNIPVEEEPLTAQLLAGELRLTLAYLLPELNPCRDRAGAARALSIGLDELLDGDGTPHSMYLHVFRPLLACWTRCRAIGEELPGGGWDDNAEDQYQAAIEIALRLTRADGSQALSDAATGGADAPLFRAARRMARNRTVDCLSKVVRPARGQPTAAEASSSELPLPSSHSPWGELAMLRTDWGRSAPRLTVAYGNRQLSTELSVGRDVLWSGVTNPEVCIDGSPRSAVSDWEEVSWESDADMDYLELEIHLAGGWRVQRQVLLAREEQFLLAADAVLGSQPSRIDYSMTLPLGPKIRFAAAEETREGRLVGRKPRATVLPLALPEWRTDSRGGALTCADGGLQLRQAAEGKCLYAPLFFDLAPRRLAKEVTWRQLTVAQQRENQPPDVAVGYRVRIGKRQWLVYRSLARQEIRTVLGQNLKSEFLIGRFHRCGTIDKLVEIEPA